LNDASRDDEARPSTGHVTVFRGGHVLTLDPERPGLGEIRDGALVVLDDRILWVGREADLSGSLLPSGSESSVTEVDAGGGWITPGLIDCHTHLVFGGSRADEFRQRQAGASYESIAREGGGILSTVRETRSASLSDLVASGARRLDALVATGVTSLEIKSGYGLEWETESRMLRAAGEIAAARGMLLSRTFLGAHTLPPEFEGRGEEYVDLLVEEMIPAAASAGLADAVDAFCETIAFSPSQCRRVLESGAAHGLAGRLHADQLSDLGGADLAAGVGARSADHLEYASAEGIGAMGEAGCAAVLLPGAFYALGETRPPPVDAMRAAGVSMAVSTDCNPGSSPLLSLPQAMNFGAMLFGMSVEELWRAVTDVPARVLGWEGEVGALRAGLRADVAVWAMDAPVDLIYWMGPSPLVASLAGGRALVPRGSPA
jgi:imidazolonepropionase